MQGCPRLSPLVIVAALAAVASGIYAAFARDLAIAKSRLLNHSDIFETSFGALEYAAIGEGEPVLIVHGAGGGFDQGLDMARALAAQGYRLIAPSRFGYLRSALPEGATAAMQANAYVEMLDRLGVEKVVVLSISAGAWSSLQFCIRHPERCRALVLMVPADYLPTGISNRGGALVKAIVSSDFFAWAAFRLMPAKAGKVAQTVLGTDSTVLRAAGPDEKARVRQILDHLLPVSLRSKGMRFDIGTAAAREPLAIEKITCPVLTISAEDDRFHTADRARHIVSSLANGRAVIYPTGGHALVGRHASALRETTSFIQKLPDSASRSGHGVK